MLARFLVKVSVQKKTARRFRPGGFGICLNFVFLRTTLFRRLPKPGKEAKKSIKRMCEVESHLFNLNNSWPLCKRVQPDSSKSWPAVVPIQLKNKELGKRPAPLHILFALKVKLIRMTPNSTPNPIHPPVAVYPAVLQPASTSNPSPLEAAVSSLAQQLKAQHTELIGMVNMQACPSAVLAQAHNASNQALESLYSAMPQLESEMASTSESPIELSRVARTSALGVISTALSLNPNNLNAWHCSLRLFQDESQNVTVMRNGSNQVINRGAANRVLLVDITGDQNIGRPSSQHQ